MNTPHPDYKNLNELDLEYADHYFETGNTACLRQLKEKSKRREKRSEPARLHHTRTNRS